MSNIAKTFKKKTPCDFNRQLGEEIILSDQECNRCDILTYALECYRYAGNSILFEFSADNRTVEEIGIANEQISLIDKQGTGAFDANYYSSVIRAKI